MPYCGAMHKKGFCFIEVVGALAQPVFGKSNKIKDGPARDGDLPATFASIKNGADESRRLLTLTCSMKPGPIVLSEIFVDVETSAFHSPIKRYRYDGTGSK